MQLFSNNLKEALKYLDKQDLQLIQRKGIEYSDSQHQQQIQNTYLQNLSKLQPHLKQNFLNNEIIFLKNQLLRQKIGYQQQMNRIRSQFFIQNDKLNGQLKNIRTKAIYYQGQLPLISQALNTVRDMLSGLIPQSIYQRLKGVNTKQLPPNQFIIVHAWQLINPFKKQSQNSRRQIAKLRQEINNKSDKYQQTLGQLQHFSRLLQTKDQDQKRHILNFQNSKKSMQLQIIKLRDQIRILAQKGVQYDQLLRDFNLSKQQNLMLQQRFKVIGVKNQQFMKQQPIDIYRKYQLLLSDKEHLIKQNVQILQKNRRLEDRLQNFQQQLIITKNQSQKYLSQLLNSKSVTSIQYQKKISREIKQLNQKKALDIQNLKMHYSEMYTQQLRFIKQAKDQVQRRLQIVTRQMKQKQRAYQQSLIQNRSLQKKYDIDTAQLRVSIILKGQQIQRLSNHYQQSIIRLNVLKTQNQMLHQKILTLKSQYYKLQSHSKQQSSNIRAQLTLAKQQISNYQILQKQIDQAVLTLSQGKNNEKNIYLKTLSNAPSNSMRRIQQSLNLAQRLNKRQKQYQQNQQKIILKQKQITNLHKQLNSLKKLIENSSHPYSYLISNIQQKQSQIIKLNVMLRRKQQQSINLRQQFNSQISQIQKLKFDLQNTLVKKQKIQNIQQMLISIANRQNIPSKFQLGNVIQQMRQIIGRKQFQSNPNWFNRLKNKI